MNKKYYKKIVSLLLLLFFSQALYATRIVINGRPVELVLHRDFYKFPHGYVPENAGFHFISILDVARVCFMQKRKSLANLEMVAIILESDLEQKMRWYCYQYDPRYFEVDY